MRMAITAASAFVAADIVGVSHFVVVGDVVADERRERN